MAMKKKRGKRKGAAPPPLKRGRKKELKRFEMDVWTHGDMQPDPVSERATAPNEVAFVVRTSGGTPLNTSDAKKLFRMLQHEIRALGHHLKRKGQPLDPEPKAPKEPKGPTKEPAPEPAAPEPEETQASPSPESEDHAEPEAKAAANPVDPDDSDAETPTHHVEETPKP